MKIKIVYFLFLISTLFSCKNESNSSLDYRTTSVESLSVNGDFEKETIDEVKQVDESKIGERKLIKRGDISFETSNKIKTHFQISEAVKKNKGYISKDNDENTYDRSQTKISIKVPFKNFDKLLNSISEGVKEFESKNISVNDVTEEFFDVTARAKTKKKLEDRYIQLLKKTKTVEEVIIVEKELEQVRSDIERMDGRLRYLQNNVSYSTLNITYYKAIKITRFKNKYSDKVKEAFTSGFEGVKSLILVLVYLWPLIIFLIIFYFVLKKYRKKVK